MIGTREELVGAVIEVAVKNWWPRDAEIRFHGDELCPILRTAGPWGLADAIFASREGPASIHIDDRLLLGRSEELVRRVATTALGLDRAAARGCPVADVALEGVDLALLFGEGSYVEWCPRCGRAAVCSVSSVAFGGRHVTGRCEACGAKTRAGKSLAGVVTTVSGDILFDGVDRLFPFGVESACRFVRQDERIKGANARGAALRDHVAAGGKGPSGALAAIRASSLVEYVDVDDVMVCPMTLSVVDDRSRNTEPYVWLEAGTICCDGIEVHDWRLNSGGFTLDEALSELAWQCSHYKEGAPRRYV